MGDLRLYKNEKAYSHDVLALGHCQNLCMMVSKVLCSQTIYLDAMIYGYLQQGPCATKTKGNLPPFCSFS
jgi:hypothetical protein